MVKLGIINRDRFVGRPNVSVVPMASNWSYDDPTGLQDAVELIEAVNAAGGNFVLVVKRGAAWVAVEKEG